MLSLAASVAGFLAAQFAIALYSEQVSDVYMDIYEQGFYITGGTPAATEPLTLTQSEKDIIANYCEIPAVQTFALDMQLNTKSGG